MHDNNLPSAICLSGRRQSTHDVSNLTSPTSSSEQPRSFVNFSAPLLEYLKDLEAKLLWLDPHLFELWGASDGRSPAVNTSTNNTSRGNSLSAVRRRRRGSSSASAIQETRAKIQHVLDMLRRLRSDVYSYLPELPSVDDTRSHIHDGIPSFQELNAHLSSRESLEKLEPDKISASYLSTLKTHLDSLHEQIDLLGPPSPFSRQFPSLTTHPFYGTISDIIYKLQDPGILTDPLKKPLDVIGTLGESRPSPIEAMKLHFQFDFEVKRGLKESNNGKRLISYEFVPQKYRSSHYVKTGYRFIPFSAWPRLLLSLFQLHNETVNIMTHLIPFLYSLRAIWTSLPPFPHFLESVSANFATAESAEDIINSFDIPKHVFVLAANFCLLCSCIWHTTAGCSDLEIAELGAKVDYLGIGWLITTSSMTFVYYGFACQPTMAYVYISLVVCQGIAASILPFNASFNATTNKNGRIAFFASLAIVNIVPLIHLILIHSVHDIYLFFLPTTRSLLSYFAGFIVFVYNIPERFVPEKWRWFTDLFGGGSHAVWHVCVLFAIHFHAQAIVHYQNGIGNEPSCELVWYWW